MLWAGAGLPPTRPRSFLSILELGMPGTGIPSAVRATLGNPDRPVVCVAGDGAAGFHFMDPRGGRKAVVRVCTAGGMATVAYREQ